MKFVYLHLNSPAANTDPLWIMSVLTKLLFQMTTVQENPEFLCTASVKFRVFQHLIFKTLCNSTAHGMPKYHTKHAWVMFLHCTYVLSPDLQKTSVSADSVWLYPPLLDFVLT